MKILSIAAAALVALTGPVLFGAAATPAAAQERVVVRERVVTPAATTRVIVRDRTTTTRSSYGYRRQPRRVCTVRYRRGERIRTCRTRYYRSRY